MGFGIKAGPSSRMERQGHKPEQEKQTMPVDACGCLAARRGSGGQ